MTGSLFDTVSSLLVNFKTLALMVMLCLILSMTDLQADVDDATSAMPVDQSEQNHPAGLPADSLDSSPGQFYQEAAKTILSKPPFVNERTTYTLQWGDEKTESNRLEDWLVKLFELLSESGLNVDAGLLSTLAALLEVIFWLTVTVLTGWLLWRYRKLLAYFRHKRPDADRHLSQTRLAEQDSDQLPDNLALKIQEAIDQGHYRQALAWLYQASLRSLNQSESNQSGLDQAELNQPVSAIGVDQTEHEVIRQLKQSRTSISQLTTHLAGYRIPYIYAEQFCSDQQIKHDLQQFYHQWQDIVAQ